MLNKEKAGRCNQPWHPIYSKIKKEKKECNNTYWYIKRKIVLCIIKYFLKLKEKVSSTTFVNMDGSPKIDQNFFLYISWL